MFLSVFRKILLPPPGSGLFYGIIFLFACEQVKITGAIRLRQVLEEFLPVSNQHSLYNEWKGGYPRGYGLFVHISGPEKGNQCFKKGEQLSFSLVIYGHCDEYGEAFLQALTGMCRNGLNKGTIPLHLACVSERQEDGSVQMLYHEDGGAFFFSCGIPLHWAGIFIVK